MKQIVLFLIVSIGLLSCNKNMIQLVSLSPIEKQTIERNKEYVFENDTVKIIYRFWDSHGKFEFSVENKLDIPIYIDWKKSNLIYNSTPNVYWVEETVVKLNTVTTGVGFRGAYGTAYGSAITTGESVSRPKERITFLPPHSSITRNEYSIENAYYYVIDPNTQPSIVPNDSKPKKSTKIYTQEFTSGSTFLNLTNFLTISTSENFEKEQFIKNNFYVKQISEMELNHFRGKCTGTDENDVPICPRKLKSDTKYYLKVPKGFDFENRRKRHITNYVNPYKP